MKYKKAQSEGLGLVLIVALLVFIMIFVLIFSLAESTDSTSAEYRMSSMTSNMISTIFRTNVQECNDYTITELIIDCGGKKDLNCNDNEGSCYWVNETLFTIFNETLDAWHENYVFELKGNSLDEEIVFRGGDWENWTIGATPSTMPIVTFGDPIEAKLTIYE